MADEQPPADAPPAEEVPATEEAAAPVEAAPVADAPAATEAPVEAAAPVSVSDAEPQQAAAATAATTDAPPESAAVADASNPAPPALPPPSPEEAAQLLPPPQPVQTLVESTTPHLKRKDVYHKPAEDLPEDVEFQLARAYLLQNSEKSEMNIYDHLTLTVMRVLETRPKNPIDIFESISSEIKRSKFRSVDPLSAVFKPAFDSVPGVKVAKAQLKLYEQPPQEEAPDEGLGEIPDIMDLSNLWEWAGVSFGREETFMLFLSLRKLVAEKPLKSVRLWGKIHGLNASYIITEGELKDGAEDEDGPIANGVVDPEAIAAAEAAAAEAAAAEAPAAAAEGEGAPPAAPVEDPTLPKPKQKIIPPLPKEERIGVNRYVYYVCAYPGAPWIRLPDVIPEKLQISRKIRKYFTGDLKHQIISYPKFEANEAQYLRCQIARISAATVASPAGYYTFDPEDEGNEEEGHQPTIIINPEFEGLQNDSLLLLSNWVHHVPYILPQGRVTWENPYASLSKGGEDGEDEGDDEEKEEGEGGEEEEDPAATAEPETGPPLLTPLASDEDAAEGGPAWVTRPCSTLSPVKFTPVTLRSTRWPGAVIVAYNDKFANIYVGDGHGDIPKGGFLSDGLLLPPVLGEVAKEFVVVEKEENPDDPENPIVKEHGMVEQKDPTVEEEDAFEEAKRAKEEEAKEAAEEEAEAPEEEDE